MDTPTTFVAEEIRILLSDVKSMFDNLGQPAFFIEGVNSPLDQARVGLETLEQFTMMREKYSDDLAWATSHDHQHARRNKKHYK